MYRSCREIRPEVICASALAAPIILLLLMPVTVHGLLDGAHAALLSGLHRQMAAVGANANGAWVPFSEDLGLVAMNVVLIALIVRRTHSDRSNVRRLERANRELAEYAERDGLTGLINHRTFHDSLAAEFVLQTRGSALISLLMIDVDHFKSFNDRFGHQAGDAILARIGRVLAEVGRPSDVVARYGGEEFAILLRATGEHAAYEIAERIRARIEADTRQSEPVTASIGVASCRRESTTPTDLITMADRAMYLSKERGRNRVTIAGNGPSEFMPRQAAPSGVAA